MSWSRMGCAVALAMVVAGCSSGGGGQQGADAAASPGKGDAQVVVPAPDAADAQQGGGAGDGLSGDDAASGAAGDATRPAPRAPTCSTAEDCKDGELCDCLGRCVADPGGTECVEDKNCGGGAWCDTCIGRCRDQVGLCEPCTSSSACEGTGSACLDYASGGSFCGLGCLTDVGCPAGYRCEQVPGHTSNQCVPSSGLCGAPGECTKDGDCTPPLVCNAALRRCAPGCVDDEACPQGQVCSAGRCGPPCDDASNPCPAGQTCVSGHCKVPGGCVDSSECPEPETHCDATSHLCVPGCETDADCKSFSKVCKQGKCVEKGCEANWYCAFGEVCDLATGKCQPAEGPYCATCDPDNDTVCKTAGADNLCVNFQDEDGNDLGAFCLVACGADPANPCPQGWACTEVDLGDGKPPRHLCVRDCPTPPIGQ